MPTYGTLISNIWVLFILFTIINAYQLKARTKKFIEQQPELQEGYDQLFKGYLIYMNIPWIVMGFGILLGGVPDVFSFLRPREGNLFVFAFHVSILALWALAIWWLYFNDGAEFLVKYPGALNRNIESVKSIKYYFAACLMGGVLGMILMWSF
jgi:hypothetical protein